MFKYFYCEEAASAGDLEELKKMRNAGFDWDIWTPVAAATNGHLNCLRYLHENNCPIDKRTSYYAVKNGHIDCLKYIFENNLEYDSFTTAWAASNGHLNCLQYAHSNGCKLDYVAPVWAADYSNLECFKYCFQYCTNPQIFWNINFELENIIEKIDLDDPIWRKLFTINLNKYPTLETKVNKKKKEINDLQNELSNCLKYFLCNDIILYCIDPFI